MSRREADHADTADPAVHDLHHGHRHPLRLLLSHQAAESRAGAGGGRCLFTRVLRFLLQYLSKGCLVIQN